MPSTRLEFNNNGFVITGKDIDIKFNCSPNKFWDPIDQLYIILIKALSELKNHQANIICYNDSKIIEELNGSIKTISDTSKILRDTVLRKIIPTMKGFVFFEKRAVNIPPFRYKDPPVLLEKKINKAEKLKEQWFNGYHPSN